MVIVHVVITPNISREHTDGAVSFNFQSRNYSRNVRSEQFDCDSFGIVRDLGRHRSSAWNCRPIVPKEDLIKMEKKLVLVTGAAGGVARHLVRQLVENCSDRVQVRALEVNPKATKKHLGKHLHSVDFRLGDLRDSDFVKSCLEDVDIVFHLGGVIPPWADKHPKEAHNINVGGTKNILAGIKELGTSPFILYSSSISVYGDRVQNPDIRLGDPETPADRDEYAHTKLESEKLIKESGIDYSIFRLTGIFGADTHGVDPIMFHMPMDTKVEIATPQDTARAFVNSIDKLEELKGRTFNLGGGLACRTNYRELMERSFQVVGLGKPRFPEKAFATRNFHCGDYVDGDELEELLHFRNDTLEDYFKEMKRTTPAVQRLFTTMLSPVIQYFLLRLSDPYKAFKKSDQKEMAHYFRPEDL